MLNSRGAPNDGDTPVLERAARIVVLVSALVALATALNLASGFWPVRWYGAAAFVLAFALGRSRRPLVAAALFATCYLVPAIIGFAYELFIAAYFCIWLAGLMGLIAATASWRRWSLPPALRLPIALWSLVIAVGWPLVCLREYDFTRASSDGWSASSMAVGVPPVWSMMGVANAAGILLVALLCLDWLFALYRDDRSGVAREIALWLGISAAISAAVALYQGTVDIYFLNGGVFPSVGRASGTMRDANPYGVLTALWAPAGIAVVLSLWEDCSPLVLIAVLLLSWCGAWVSGSRNALVVGMIGLLVVVWERGRALSRRAQLMLLGGCGVLALAAAAFVLAVGQSVNSPVSRFREMFRIASVNGGGVVDKVERFWDPYGYGEVTWRLIREFPLFGIGVGAYNLVVVDFARSIGYVSIVSDNAQNWFRHQFVELGIVGSLGWMAWTLLFAFLIVAGRPRASSSRSVTNIVRSLPVLFLIVSLVGMPAMNAQASITFAIFCAWYLLLIDPAVLDARLPFARRRGAWVAVWAIVLLFAGGTLVSGWTGLRPPRRAARFGWHYTYGFYDPETEADGTEHRWAAKNAVAVVDTPDPWLRLTVWVNHLDIAQKPVDVQVWRDDTPVLSTRLTSMAPVVRYLRVPTGKPRVIIQTRVNRAVNPKDFGSSDDRELGLIVKWEPVFRPPADAELVK
jgi:hypothetical protein